MVALLQLGFGVARAAQIARARWRWPRPYHRLVLRPDFPDTQEADEVVSELALYLQGETVKIHLTVPDGPREIIIGPSQSVGPASSRLGRPLVLYWDAVAATGFRLASPRTRFIDRHRGGKNESITLARLAYSDTWSRSSKSDMAALGQANLGSFRRAISGRRGSQLFATGPSLSHLDLNAVAEPNSLRIVCNSIVSNDAVMSLLRPDLVTFGDPAFHFGSSEYSQQFRRDLRRQMRSNPELRALFPLEFSANVYDLVVEFPSRAIPVPIAWPWYRSVDRLAATGEGLRTGNIMTSLMLPASYLVDGEVQLFGFDGRKPSDKEFWQHSARAQYSEAVYSSVRSRHPAFFLEAGFESYYDKHCSIVQQMVTSLEQHGRDVLCRTPSAIPALEDRYSAIK